MLQASSDRYHLLVSALRRRSGEAVAEIFRQAWFSPSLSDCPPPVEWARLLEAPLDDHLGLPASSLVAWPASPGDRSRDRSSVAAVAMDWPAAPLAALPEPWSPAAEHAATLPVPPDEKHLPLLSRPPPPVCSWWAVCSFYNRIKSARTDLQCWSPGNWRALGREDCFFRGKPGGRYILRRRNTCTG
jgi:hypothetical protein